MPAIALLKFIQGSRQPAAGYALIVEPSVQVDIENGGDNSDVNSWRVELLDAPTGFGTVTPGAPQLLAENDDDSNPAANVTPGAPTLPGCYRIRLRVWTGTNYSGTLDTDIRNICVLAPNQKIILPPYQKLPDPLPLPGEGKPGEKPDELNFEGQPTGWSGPTKYQAGGWGSDYDYFRLLNATLYLIDSHLAGGGPLPIGTGLGQFLYWDGSSWDATAQVYGPGNLSAGVASPYFDVYRGQVGTAGTEYQSVEGYSVFQTIRQWFTDHYEPRTFWRSLPLKTIEAGPVRGQMLGMQWDTQDSAYRVRWSLAAVPPTVGVGEEAILAWNETNGEAYWYAFRTIPGGVGGSVLFWNSFTGRWQSNSAPANPGQHLISGWNGVNSYYYVYWETPLVLPPGTATEYGQFLVWRNDQWEASTVPPNQVDGYIPYIAGDTLQWLLKSAGTTDELVKCSSNDTTAAFLEDKLVAGTGISLATLNDGGDEDLQVSLAAHALGGASHSADSLANLNSKVSDANLVPEARTLSMNLPLRIDGGGSADLSADRSLSINTVQQSFAGVVPSTSSAGYAWLLTSSNGSSVSWQTPPVWMPARKSTAGSLVKGKAVYVTGYDVTNSCALVEYADCDDPSKMPAVGITMEVLSDTVTGRVAVTGTVSNVDASFGGGWSEGDVLYVDTGGLGQMTNTRPSSTSAIIQRMGEVIRANPTVGIIELAGMTAPAELPQFTAAGSIWYGGATGTPTELPQGSNGEFLGVSGGVLGFYTPAVGTHALGGSEHTADTLANLNSKVSDANLVPEARNLTAGAGMTGGGDLSADRTFDVVANADGSIAVNANDIQVGVLASDAQHGNLGGGSLHDVVGITDPGFAPGVPDASDYALLTAAGSPSFSKIANSHISTAAGIVVSKLAGGADGTVLVTDANGDPIWLGPGTTGQLLRSNGAGATPSWYTLTLDDLTQGVDVHGTIAFKGASAWQALAPGSAGQVLQSNGGGADPTWVTPTGEGNTASNAGSGTSLFYQKSGVDLQFNGIKSENDRLSVALDGVSHDVELTVNEGNIVHQNLSGAGTQTHANIDSHIGSSSNPHSTTLANLTDTDLTGIAQGSILYRNATQWVVLAPGTSGQHLRTNGAAANPSWETPTTGDVTGPASSQDNVICRFSGTTGKLIQGGGADGVSDNPPTYDDSGNFYVDANGSSTASPRIFGAANFSDPGTPEAVRWEFGDSANSISNVYGGAMTVRSYHTLILRGNNSNLDTSWSTETGIGVWIDNTAADAPALVVEGAVSQSAALQIWRDSSGTTLSQITSTGDLDLNDNDLFRVKLATFSDFHNAGSVGGGGEIDIDPINGNKQYCTFSGATGTLNFDPLPTAGETANLIVMVISTTTALTTLNLEANEGTDVVYAGGSSLDVEALGTTILGVFYDGTGDVYVTSDPTQGAVTTANLV